jgi:hypothetical protein
MFMTVIWEGCEENNPRVSYFKEGLLFSQSSRLAGEIYENENFDSKSPNRNSNRRVSKIRDGQNTTSDPVAVRGRI